MPKSISWWNGLLFLGDGINDFEIIGQGVVPFFFSGDIPWEAESGFVDFQQPLHIVLRDIVDVKPVADFFDLTGRQAAQEKRIVTDIEKVFLEIVDDINTLVGHAGERSNRIHDVADIAVILGSNPLDRIIQNEKILYSSHNSTI